jgi:hypothetical protein
MLARCDEVVAVLFESSFGCRIVRVFVRIYGYAGFMKTPSAPSRIHTRARAHSAALSADSAMLGGLEANLTGIPVAVWFKSRY